MQNSFSQRSQGADLVAGGVRYRTWAPGKSEVAAVISNRAGAEQRIIRLTKSEDGYFAGLDAQGRAGDRYQYRFEGRDWPDPASRFNPDGVHGPAEVIDPRDYQWQDGSWRAPAFSGLVLYELHLGTFHAGRDFSGDDREARYLVDLGVNAIEIMPIADFPAHETGVTTACLLYAPARGLRVAQRTASAGRCGPQPRHRGVLDVVYNHLVRMELSRDTVGPYFFTRSTRRPGAMRSISTRAGGRANFLENAATGGGNFTSMASALMRRTRCRRLGNAYSRGGGGASALVRRITYGGGRTERAAALFPTGPRGHGTRRGLGGRFSPRCTRLLTGASEGYYRSYEGTVEELAATLRDGWLLHRASHGRVANECA